jgi:ligand-binding sensor domain-containing protein
MLTQKNRKRNLFLAMLTGLCLPISCYAQEYSYTHYDIGDGLAGSTVYCIAQDRDGFIWASTETGVSRFDGTHFRNFTIADGLPDIEVLQLFGDRDGRLWMAPFRKSVCYWYKGRIHNQDNDPILSKVHLRQNIEYFVEDSAGNMLIQENSALHLILRNGTVKEYDSLGQVPVFPSVAACLDSSGHFLVQVGDRVFRISEAGFSLVRVLPFTVVHPNLVAMSGSSVIWRVAASTYSVLSLVTGRVFRRKVGLNLYRHISFTLLQDSLLYVNEIFGCQENNIRSGETRRFLSDKPVSRVFRDMDGNLWFATLGQGIYRLNSDQFGIRKIPSLHAETSSVVSILRTEEGLWVGNDRQQLFRLSLPGLRDDPRNSNEPVAKNRLLYLDTVNDGKIVAGGDNHLAELKGPGYRPIRMVSASVKSIVRRPDGRLLVATVWGVGNFDVKRWRFIDTFWRERATAVSCYLDTVYIGTLTGLYRLVGNRPPELMGASEPLLRTRISAIVRGARGIYWIATYGSGIVGFRGDSVVTVINKQHGLTSDICRCLLLHNQILWEGTDRGLNRIELDKPGYPVTAFTSNDGVGSDIINTVYASDSMIYVGTPAGLSYFNPGKIGEHEPCRVYLLSALSGSGTDRVGDTANLVIPFGDRSIRFGYVGISYRSGGDITYRYRMMGLDSSWRTTRLTELEYAVLPPGAYEFQLTAINKFGASSGLLSQRFSVVTPFWLTTWFDVLVVVIFALGTLGMASWRIRTIRRRQREKDQLARKMMELERMALQAQMNPHFIFNCLTSVQQYVVDRDIFSANKYIAGLARLIRLTLHNSSLAFITLADEVAYLSAYLALEKLRFKEKMEYAIDVDPQILQNSCYIPPMLIQPYVENSVRHGLRHRKGRMGHIWLRVSQGKEPQRPGLTVIVEDNGIGRERSAQYKTAEHIEYQSKGMTMTADRIRIINATYGADIQVEVIDLKDADNQAAGTRVVMQFKAFDHLHPNQKATS